jgi:hypothetical protein
MVAATRLATIVSWSWIGILTSILVGQAVLAWLRFRWASSLAGRSELLARSLRDASPPRELPGEPFEAIEPRGLPTARGTHR